MKSSDCVRNHSKSFDWTSAAVSFLAQRGPFSVNLLVEVLSMTLEHFTGHARRKPPQVVV